MDSAARCPRQRSVPRLLKRFMARAAFRNFKGTIRRLGIEEAWYAYKQRALEDIAREWLAEHGLEVDESRPTSGVTPHSACPPVAEQPISPVNEVGKRLVRDDEKGRV